MEIRWIITKENRKPYEDFIAQHKSHSIVSERIDRNIGRIDVAISKPRFWRTLVGCLLTTQQKSGRGSRVAKFLDAKGPVLDVDYCLRSKNLAAFVERSLSENGLRRSERIAAEIEHAALWLNQHGWPAIRAQLTLLSSHTSAKKERTVARFLQQHFKGIGPKQSRNLIQWMGLSRYEIPLDSRMVKVLKELQYPVPLSATALADEQYYCFVEDGIQRIMASIGVYPCVFDACAFASFERAEKGS